MWADHDGVTLVTPAIPMRLDHHCAHSWPWGGSEGRRWDSETAGTRAPCQPGECRGQGGALASGFPHPPIWSKYMQSPDEAQAPQASVGSSYKPELWVCPS